MLDAWLAGDVPHAVMADWCEEHGLAFPGTACFTMRVLVGWESIDIRARDVERSFSGASSRERIKSHSGGHLGLTFRSRSRSCSSRGGGGHSFSYSCGRMMSGSNGQRADRVAAVFSRRNRRLRDN